MFPGFGGKLPGEDFMHSFYPIAIALVFGLIYGVRSLMRGAQATCREGAEGKTVVVTGGSGGIGLETVRLFAERGARVVVGCRDVEKAKQSIEDIKTMTKNGNIYILALDLCSLKSVRKFVQDFKKKEKRLDILVNNAGVMCHPQAKTEDNFEMHFQTNYLGHFLLTMSLLDLMKQNGEGARIINVAAPAYRLAELDFDDLQYEKREYAAGAAYSQSKLCVMLFTLQLAKHLEGSQVTVNSVDPGVARTGIHRHMPFRKQALVSFTFAPFIWFLMKNSKDGAQTTLQCALAAEEKSVSGKLYKECKMIEAEDSGKNAEAAEKLWQISQQLCGFDQ